MEKTDYIIEQAAQMLIDCVEKYVRQECSRGTLLSRKDALKEALTKDTPKEKYWESQYYINVPWPESQKLLSLEQQIEDGDIILGPDQSCFITIDFYNNVIRNGLQDRTEGTME